MRNLTKRGLDLYGPHRTISSSKGFRPLLDREEVKYRVRVYPHRAIGPAIARGCMAMSRSIRDPRAAVMIAVFIFLMAVPFVTMVGSEESKASTFPINVRGYVMDTANNKIQGANVTVEMVNDTTGDVTKRMRLCWLLLLASLRLPLHLFPNQ